MCNNTIEEDWMKELSGEKKMAGSESTQCEETTSD